MAALHTKVVHHDPGCLKAGSCDEEVCDYIYDGMSSKPGPTGRGIPEGLQSRVTSKRCMTCAHMVVGDTFVCNVSGRKYDVNGNSSILRLYT
jgi:hypothetical protein